jgi:uncharacterized protein (TIGR02611 family)
VEELAKRVTPGGGGRASAVIAAARKVAVLIVGTIVLVVGVALVVLPGPAFLVIPAGLAILATEFEWARRLLRYAKDRAAAVVERARRARAVAGPEGSRRSSMTDA